MVSKLNPDDFRSCRLILDPDDFALGDDGPDPPPSDLIPRKVWEGIMTLPGDVAIRTTNHQGARAAMLYRLHVAWMGAIPAEGVVAEAMLEAGDDFEAALFNLLHGFYKQAISSLRSAIELMMLGCTSEIAMNTETWTAWENGEEIKIKEVFDKVQRVPVIRAFEDEVRRITGTSLFAGDNGSGRNAWARSLYRRLSSYSHTRGITTNSYFWQSNGPVYSTEGLRVSYQSLLETYAFLLLIGRIACPGLRMPNGARVIYERDSLGQFLELSFRVLCEHCVSRLFDGNNGQSKVKPG
jgi:hypothetical protein